VALRGFETWWERFSATGDICPLRLGQTRDEVRAILGEPDDVSRVMPRKRWKRLPAIWKYGDVELHFGSSAEEPLWLIYMEENGGVALCISRITSRGGRRGSAS
jgi:hypothetical protein